MENYIGQKFGKLKVIGEDKCYISPSGRKIRKMICICDCGNKHSTTIQNLQRGYTKSCGCFQRENAKEQETTHGMSKTRPYRLWNQIIMRCLNKRSVSYKKYGAKGIKVCDEWKKFEGFWNDMKDAYFDNAQIDRIDNSKGYSKENCRWATAKQQQNNRTNNKVLTLNGESKTLMQWSEFLKIKRQTIQSRLVRGWSVEKALTTSVRKKHCKFNKNNK